MQFQNPSDSGFTKIKDHISGQHKNLLSLKQQHELLDQEIQARILLLNEAQQRRNALAGDIQTHNIRITKKEEMLSREQAQLANLLQEAEQIKERTGAEKAEQRKYLQHYESKMKKIGGKLQSSPVIYEQKNIQAEICTLHEEATAVAKDLKEIERELNALQHKYSAMLRISASSESVQNGAQMLRGLESVVKQMSEEEILHNDEEHKLVDELESLAKMSNSLREQMNKAM